MADDPDTDGYVSDSEFERDQDYLSSRVTADGRDG
jgi:hypothetical protein